MQVFKVGLVMAAGLGSTWAARTVTDAVFGAPAGQYLAQAAEQSAAGQQPAPAPAPASTPAPEPAPAAGDAATAPPPVPEMSRKEMEDELKRAQAEIAGKPGAGELEEFRPTKPLPADIAVALPSDI